MSLTVHCFCVKVTRGFYIIDFSGQFSFVLEIFMVFFCCFFTVVAMCGQVHGVETIQVLC